MAPRSSSTSMKSRNGWTCFAAWDITGLWAGVSNLNRPPLPYEGHQPASRTTTTVWYLPSVDACIAMRDLLMASHNTFYHDYDIVVAARTKAGMGEGSAPVKSAIGPIPQDSKSITLSCGKLMTGVTVPAWTGILMLRELKSPESYFQAAFRVQSPWASKLVNTEVGGQDEIIQGTLLRPDFSRTGHCAKSSTTRRGCAADVATERNDKRPLTSSWSSSPVLSFDGYAMAQLHAADVIDFLTKGISSSMLARRWNSRNCSPSTFGQWKRC